MAVRPFGEPLGQLRDESLILPLQGNVVKECHRLRAQADKVVHSHRNAINPDRIELFHQLGD